MRLAFSKYQYLKSLHGRDIKPAHYRVLVTLLDYANADGSNARPGNERLAADCCMHIETVKKAVRWLREHKYVEETHTGGKHLGASAYRFPLRPQGSLETSLTENVREVQNGETPASQGSPQTSPPKEYQNTEASMPSECASAAGVTAEVQQDFEGLASPADKGGKFKEKYASQIKDLDPWTPHLARSTGEHLPAPLRSTNNNAPAEDPWGPPVGARMEAAPPW